MTKGCSLEGVKLSRAQTFELLAASHGHKSYASFKALHDKELLTSLSTKDFSNAVAHVIGRMNEILGASNKLFAETLVASLHKNIAINSSYDFRSETSNLICFYIHHYGDNLRSGLSHLTHIYLMALNNIGLSISLNHTAVKLSPLVYKHFMAESKSPLTDVLKIKRIHYPTDHIVDLSVKLTNTQWADLSNSTIGPYMSENSLILSNTINKTPVSSRLIQSIRDFLSREEEYKDFMSKFEKSKMCLLSVTCSSLDNINDFLENKLSYSFTEHGEKGIFGYSTGENKIELVDTFIAIFYLSNEEITLDVEIAGYIRTEIQIGDSCLNIKPLFNECQDLIAKVSIATNDFGNVVVEDKWFDLNSSQVDLINDLYQKIVPNMRKAKYFYACAMDNILSVPDEDMF